MRMFSEKVIREYGEQETRTKLVWPHLKVFWLRKYESTGQKVKKKKRHSEEELGSGQGWTVSPTRAAPDRTWGKGVVLKTFAVPPALPPPPSPPIKYGTD